MMAGVLEADQFSPRVKIGVGMLIAALVVGGISYDPQIYIVVVGCMTLPLAVAYPLLYSRLPWKKSLLGRALMTKARSVALLYVVGMVNIFWPLPFHGYLMALVTTYLFVGIGFQLIVMIRVQNEGNIRRRRRRESENVT